MAFYEIELKLIENTVGKMCPRRSPSHLRDQVRTVYLIANHEVEVYEQRPRRGNPEEWINSGIAKFLYTRTAKRWKLYWMRQDRKWHLYGAVPDPTTLEKLVAEVDQDPHGAFFG